MDVDAYLSWADGRDGRWELRDRRPVLMSPERAVHALMKYGAQKTLEAAIAQAGLLCRMFPDVMTVWIAARTASNRTPSSSARPARPQHDGDPERNKP